MTWTEHASTVDHSHEAFIQYLVKATKLSDFRLHKALLKINRAHFVPLSLQEYAHRDLALPLFEGSELLATISQPSTTALMIDALRITPECRVLEMGTGSGYSTALTAQLCKEVISIERIPELVIAARKRLSDLKINNVSILEGDGASEPTGHYDRIVATAAFKSIPSWVVHHLTEGGRCLFPIGSDPRELQLILGEKINGELQTLIIHDVQFVPMITEHESGWHLNEVTDMLRQRENQVGGEEETTFETLAVKFGIPLPEFILAVKKAFGYAADVPLEQLNGLPGWIEHLGNSSPE